MREKNSRGLRTRSVRGQKFLKRFFDAVGPESEWTWRGFICDAAIAIDDVQTIRPTGVISFGEVIEGIDDSGEVNSEFDDAELPHFAAFFVVHRLGENYVVVKIVGVLPHVAGVRFANINGIKRDAIFILFVKLIESGNLPPEWWSGVTSENEDGGLLSLHRRQLKAALVVRTFQRKVRSGIADTQAAPACDIPQRFERKNDERGPRHVLHGLRKGVGRLQHDAKQGCGDDGVKCDYRTNDF